MSAHNGADGAEPTATGSDGFGNNASSWPAADRADDVVRRRRLLTLLDSDGTGQRLPGMAGGPDELADRGGALDVRSQLGRVCAVAVPEVGVDGAGVTVMGSVEGALSGAREQLAATGELTRRLEDLQLTTGEGPCLDAYREGRPALVGDVEAEPTRWLGFGSEAVRVGAAALFSLPLQVGAVRLGTLDLHRLTPGPLSREQLTDALTVASLATEALLEFAVSDAADTADAGDAGHPADHPRVAPWAGWLPDVHADVHVGHGDGVGERRRRHDHRPAPPTGSRLRPR